MTTPPRGINGRLKDKRTLCIKSIQGFFTKMSLSVYSLIWGSLTST